jgi:hypothetical protein
MRVARDDAPVYWRAAARYAERSASDAPFSARPSLPTFSPSSWRPSSFLSWLPYNQLHLWSETPGRSPGGAAGAVPSDAARSRCERSRGCTSLSGPMLSKRVNIPREASYQLSYVLTIWDRIRRRAAQPRCVGLSAVAGVTSHPRRRENQPVRAGAGAPTISPDRNCIRARHPVVRHRPLRLVSGTMVRWRRERSCNAKAVD